MSAALLVETVGGMLAAWLAHGVWQTSVIALVAGAALWLLRRRSARTRYVVGCFALAAMARRDYDGASQDSVTVRGALRWRY